MTIDALGVVASVEARWSQHGPEVTTPGMGVEILGFERGAGAFREYVERLGSRSGEHHISWPASSVGQPGDGDDGGERGPGDGP